MNQLFMLLIFLSTVNVVNSSKQLFNIIKYRKKLMLDPLSISYLVIALTNSTYYLFYFLLNDLSCDNLLFKTIMIFMNFFLLSYLRFVEHKKKGI
jgi:hypothetical protein